MPDFGGTLRQAREARGISLQQIAGTTRISIASLQALERNEPGRMPGGIFARAIVRSYAQEVGLDPEATVREFVAQFGLEGPPSSVPPDGDERPASAPVPVLGRAGGGLALKILVATLLAAALILILTRAGDTRDQSQTRPSPLRMGGAITPPPPVAALWQRR